MVSTSRKGFVAVLALLLALTCQAAIDVSDFIQTGMGSLCCNDDGSTNTIYLGWTFEYWGLQYTSLYVNNNGLISFNGPVSEFTPSPFPIASRPAIAPYWADVDTRSSPEGCGSGIVTYESTDGNNADIDAWVQSAGLDPSFSSTHYFAATWNAVGYYSLHCDKVDTFQVVLAVDGNGNSYAIFQYNTIEWTTGDASGGSGGLGGIQAQVGFDAGDVTNYYAYPDSRTPDIINIISATQSFTPAGVTGRLVYKVNEGVVACPPSTTCDDGNACTINDVCLDDGVTCTGSFQDVQAPSITCPSDITTGNTIGTCGADIVFSADAIDNCDLAPVVVCDKDSGSTFGVGATPVTCTATDASANFASCTFMVTVEDVQAPSITCPSNITKRNKIGTCGADIVFSADAIDNCDPAPVVVCDKDSGSTFDVGATLVTCTATDASANPASCTFMVTVKPSNPCDDGNACTLTDICNGSTCKGTNNQCCGRDKKKHCGLCVDDCRKDYDEVLQFFGLSPGKRCDVKRAVGAGKLCVGTKVCCEPNGKVVGSAANKQCTWFDEKKMKKKKQQATKKV